MRRLNVGQPRTLAAGLLAFLLLSAPLSSPAATSLMPAFRQANAALREDMARAGAPTSTGDAAYAKRVSEAFNPKVVDEVRDQPLPAVMDVCAEAVQTEEAYLLLGLKKGDVSAANPQAAAQQLMRIQSQNFVRFQQEMAFAQRFGIACMALEAEKMATFVASLRPADLTPARRMGLTQVQQGIVQLVSGTALSQIDPIRPEYREMMLEALDAHIAQLSPSMSKTSRATSAMQINKILPTPSLPAFARERLVHIRAAMERADCNALCSTV